MLALPEFYGFVLVLALLAAFSGLALGVLKQTFRLIVLAFLVLRTLPFPIPRKRTRKHAYLR